MKKDKKSKKIYVVMTVGIILMSSLLVGGCINSDTKRRYSKGEIWVGFKSNVSLERANEVVHSFNSSAFRWSGPTENKSEISNRDYWEAGVNVPEGEEKKYVRLFKNHTAVESAGLCWIVG